MRSEAHGDYSLIGLTRLVTDDTFLILFNASWNTQVFIMPSSSLGATWMPVLDTTQATGSSAPSSAALPADAAYTLSPRSLLALSRTQ